MTQENKDLLLCDLCGRLPYGVICQMEDTLIDSPFYDRILTERYIELFRHHKDFYIKPYLRPMSGMTEEEQKEYHKTFRAEPYGSGIGWVYVESIHSFDWLNKHGFDYRGLIGKGLAIEVTEENNPYKD